MRRFGIIFALVLLALGACAGPGDAPRVADCEEDIVALKHAARSGDAVSQYRLANRYYVSWLNPGMCAGGGGDDAIEAYRWYTLAAAQGIEAATRHRDALAETMTRSQVEAAEDKAASWLGGG